MKIADFLLPANVMIDVSPPHKRQLLSELAQKAGEVLDIPQEQIAAELIKREELGSTGTGGGIAIPHARIKPLTKPFGILAKLRQPIDFEAIDGGPVDIVFLLLLPDTTSSEPLSALACVARKLRDSEAAKLIRQSTDSSTLYRAVASD